MRSLQCLAAMFAGISVSITTGAGAFSLHPLFIQTSHDTVTTPRRSSVLWDREEDGSGDNNKDSPPISSREADLEKVSREGAKKVKQMSMEERTKRAMLAEAVEDSIFRMELQLEAMIGEDGIIPTDPEERDECVRVAKEIKLAQQQYEDLVMGAPSAMLSTMDSLGGNNDSKSET